MNPNPNVFGPHFWFTLHSVSFFYPENPTDTDMKIHKDFYESFVHVLPCEECRKHYRILLTRYPIDGHLECREQLSRWVVFLHNQVNKRLGKKEVHYDDVVKTYRNAFTSHPNQMQKQTKGIVFGCGIALLLFVLYERIYMKKKLF